VSCRTGQKSMKEIIDKLDFINIKIFYSAKNTARRE
jgi:hypothetical protein